MTSGNQEVRESVRGSLVYDSSFVWWEGFVEKIGFESGMKNWCDGWWQGWRWCDTVDDCCEKDLKSVDWALRIVSEQLIPGVKRW